MSTLINQLGQLIQDVQLTPEQGQLIKKAICSISTAELLLNELQIADGIIHNCINNMTEEQRLKVAVDNHLDSLSAQWAFRSSDRKATIERGQRYFGESV